MTINCMANHGIVSKKECLSCALNRNNVCGYDYALLRKMFETKSEDNRKNEVHVTDITGCLRRAYYSKQFPTSEYPHETLVRFLGTGFHEMISGSDDVMDSEFPLQYGELVGTSDVVYKDGVIVDFKFSRWLKPAYLPNESHKLQVNIYAHMLRGMGRKIKQAFIQYVDASGPTKCRKCNVPVRLINGEFLCPICSNTFENAHLGTVLSEVELMNPSGVEEIINKRVGELSSSLALQSLPEAEPGFLCKYCNYNNICQENGNEISD